MNGRLIIATAAAAVSVAAAAFGTGPAVQASVFAGSLMAVWEIGAFVIEREASRLREETSNV
jgi:hypothetical protein